MSSVEPEVKDFLLRVASSFSMGALWLLVNGTLGIGLNYGFFSGRPTIGNYIFYAWFLISLAALLFYLRKKWKGPLSPQGGKKRGFYSQEEGD
jgi:hypothetical protein